MALKRSRIRWAGKPCVRGESIDDLDEYLRKQMGPPEPDHRFVHPVCVQCKGDVFSLEGTEDAMSRTCVTCILSDDDATGEGATHFICDREENGDPDEADEFGCPCGKSDEFRLSVGFSHVDVVNARGKRPRRMVKWIHVGGMCVRCGVVALYAEWKVDCAPTAHLYDLA